MRRRTMSTGTSTRALPLLEAPGLLYHEAIGMRRRMPSKEHDAYSGFFLRRGCNAEQRITRTTLCFKNFCHFTLFKR